MSHQLITRITHRYLTKKANVVSFHDAYQAFQTAWNHLLDALNNDIYRAKFRWEPLILRGSNLAETIAREKSIPRGMAKKFETAARAFVSARRTRDVPKWVEKNQRHIDLFLTTNNWDTKAEGDSNEMFSVGDFSVHNTVHLEGQKLEITKGLIEKANAFSRRSKIPQIQSVLYGDLFIVGKLQQNRTRAWYRITNDTIYVRPHLKQGSDEALDFCHEIGHRYWKKILSNDKKREWFSHHRMVGSGHYDIEMPSVGDPLPLKPRKGETEAPRITRIERGRFYFSEDRYVNYEALYRHYEREAKAIKYPSSYASTDAEEHFCESFSMYIMGVLEAEHVEAFERILRI